ncbi:unnamed protein product, partial [Rotaria sp. Silwood2]
MSSITIIPRTYSSTTSSNLPNINIPPMRPAYLNPIPPPRSIPPTYQHMVQQVQRKPALYGAGQRKYNHFHKFQIGTTTTFNGYTNYNGTNNINLPPIPVPRRNLPPVPLYNNNNNNNNNYQQRNYNYNRYNNYRRPNYYNNNNINNNTKNLPSLLDINPFHLPSEHNTRSFHHAQQYHPNQQHHLHLPRPTSRTRFHLLSQLPSQSRSRSRSPFRPPPIKPRRIYQQNNNNNNINNNNYRRPPVPLPNINNNNNNNLKGIILSDSMCSRVRTYALKNNYVNVELSYESGCDIVKMINWLQTPEGQRTVGDKQFLVFSLGTNDVGRYGVDVSLQRCSEIIRFVRQSFPGIRAIGWLALSPRWKPTRFVSAANIGQMHNQFNEHLRFLSKQLDFDIVDARLGPLDMRVEDGLHPSTTTGRRKYEGALREWFSSRAVAHFSSSLFQHHHQRQPTLTTPTPTYASILNHHQILSSQKELTMSSITIIPRSYASTTSSNLPNINIPPMRPAYLNPKPAPRTIPPTYQHLTQQVQRKPALYGAGQRKYNNFHKFQTGTTTTFNGYTNYNGSNNINLPPTPAPRQYLPPTPFYNNNNRYQQQQNYHYNRYNNYRRPNFYNNNNYNNNIKNLPSLLDINPFHLPSEHNTRSFHHAQQYHPNQQHHQHLPRPTSRTRFHILSQLPSQSRSRSHSPFRPPP